MERVERQERATFPMGEFRKDERVKSNQKKLFLCWLLFVLSCGGWFCGNQKLWLTFRPVCHSHPMHLLYVSYGTYQQQQQQQ